MLTGTTIVTSSVNVSNSKLGDALEKDCRPVVGRQKFSRLDGLMYVDINPLPKTICFFLMFKTIAKLNVK